MNISLKNIKTKYTSLPLQIRASLWFLLCSVLQKGISVITTPIFTRLMSTAEYGYYNVFNSWLNIITVFVTLRMYNAVYTQGLIKFDKEGSVWSSSLQGLTLVLTVIYTTIYLIFRSFWNELFNLTTVQMLAMLVMIWATSVFSFWAAEQRVRLTYKKLVLLTLIISVAKPVVGIILVKNANDKATARILGLMLVELIGYSSLFFAQLKRGKKFYSEKFWKYSILFCLPLVPHYLSQTVLNGADKIMIQRMIGKSEAGIYALAYSLSQLMLMVNQALLQTINPWIYQKIKERKEKKIARVAIPCLAIIGVMNIALIYFAPELVFIFAPATYYDAIWIIPPVALSGYFTFAYSLFADFEFYFEKRSFIALATALSGGLNILLNYIFINIFGYIAAGYTTLLCYMFYTLGHYMFMKKIIKEHLDNTEVYNTKTLLLMTGGFLTVGFLVLIIYKNVYIRYGIILVMLFLIIANKKKINGIIQNILATKKK